MFKNLLLVSSCALAVLSCSSKPVKLSENEIAQYRAPASAIDKMEQQFQMMMQNASSSAKLQVNYIQRLLKINYTIENEILKYEAELDNAIQRRKSDPSYSFTPQTSATYYKMMQLRFLSDEQMETIVHIYNRLYQTKEDVSFPQALRNRAASMVADINRTLTTLSNEDKIQAVQLFEHLRETLNKYHGAALSQTKDRLPASADHEWQKVEKSFAKFDKDDISHLRRKYWNQTLKRAKEIADSNEVQVEEMEGPFPQSDRSPSSEKYAPGTGTFGNIIGRSFPNGLFSLTYDDGPNAGSTIELLDYLHATKTPATMFWQTQNIIKYPASVEKAKKLRFPINSHSWTHANLVKLKSDGLDKEINQAVSVGQDKVGIQPFSGKKSFRFFRCPYGACYNPASPAIRSRLANLDLIHAYWTVDSLDWKYTKDEQRTLQLTIKGMQAAGRGVVLFHDIHPSTVRVTKSLVPWIQKQKFRLATLEGAVDEYNKGVKQ